MSRKNGDISTQNQKKKERERERKKERKEERDKIMEALWEFCSFKNKKKDTLV